MFPTRHMPDQSIDLTYDLPVFQSGSQLPEQDGEQDGLSAFNILDADKPFIYGGYVARGFIFPGPNDLPVAARGQVEGGLRPPAGSWLVAYSCGSEQTAGFRFRVFDQGRNDWALTPQWMDAKSALMDFTDADSAIPLIPTRAYLIVPYGPKGSPGQLQVYLTNLATVANDCQLCLWFAIPGVAA